jgi:hypothetical protein
VSKKILLSGLALFAVITPFCAMVQETPPTYLNRHESHADDIQAIRNLPTRYTTSVTNSDEGEFET